MRPVAQVSIAVPVKKHEERFFDNVLGGYRK